jgi:hypothetical protein
MTPARTGNGLMAFWAEFEEDYVLTYQQWHNCEHVPERVSIPGFLRGRRYRAMNNTPHFLMMYDTASPEVLSSDAYLAALNTPTPWTREALTKFRAPIRNIYRFIAAAGSPGPFVAPWITALRFNLPTQDAPDASAWLQLLIEATGADLAQLWQVDEAASLIMTKERKIYGGGPGQQQYLALIERRLPADETDPLASATGIGAFDERGNEIAGHYWLEIAHLAPTQGNET